MGAISTYIRHYYTKTITETGVDLGGGDYLSVLASDTPLDLFFYDQWGGLLCEALAVDDGLRFDFAQGQISGVQSFNNVFVRSTAGNGDVVPEIVIAKGLRVDSLRVGGGVSIKKSSTPTDPTKASLSDTNTQTIAARVNRKLLILQNLATGSSSVGLWTGGAINKGVWIPSGGGVLTLENFKGALTLYSQGANTLAYQEFY